jgi:hypothetical protein
MRSMDGSSSSWEEAMLDWSDQLSRGEVSEILIGLSVTATAVGSYACQGVP